MLINTTLLITMLFSQFSSRLVINEVMANPRGVSGAGYPEDRNEFIELFNISQETVNVRGWRITDFDATDSIIAWTDTNILIKYPQVRINTFLIPPHQYALILDPEYTSSNPSGGEIQPYQLPDSLIVLTVGNTTIGNELQTNDPLLLYSLSGDSSSFGTPFNVNDSFPYDVGDGISWERKSPELEDNRINWIGCLDSNGVTVGRANSVLSYFDLALMNIYTRPPYVAPNTADTVFVVVKNVGYQTAYCWDVVVFNDKNCNGIEDSGEQLFCTIGAGLAVNQETTLSFVWQSIASGQHTIWAIVNFPDDIRFENNRLSTIIKTSAAVGDFGLIKSIFSPDGDGIDDSLMIYYDFGEQYGRLTLLIYDLNGRLIRKLINNERVNSNNLIFWDGKNDKGQIVPIGIYVIYLEYKTTHRTISKKISAVLAKNLN